MSRLRNFTKFSQQSVAVHRKNAGIAGLGEETGRFIFQVAC